MEARKSERVIAIAIVILLIGTMVVNIWFSVWSVVKTRDVFRQEGAQAGQQALAIEVMRQIQTTGKLVIKRSDGQVIMTLVPEAPVKTK